MWTASKFEKHVEKRLRAEYGEAKARELFSAYEVARTKVVLNILNEIKGVQPDRSDHGPRHVLNVLDNAHYLLSSKPDVHGLTAMELYCLAMCIIFHDVGNLFGREHHRKRIGEIFDWARGTDAALRHEKTLVLNAVRVHTGTATDGSHDTLKEVSENDHLYSESVRLRSLAAILRFSDELAEGAQRTSEYLRTHGMYAADNAIYHEYASVTHIRPDRGTERVRLTYEIPVDLVPTPDDAKRRLGSLLLFAYGRIVKLDQERRYARFYSEALSPFKATHVTMNFHCRGELLDLDLAPIEIDDKVVPGDPAKAIVEIDKHYDVDPLLERLISLSQE